LDIAQSNQHVRRVPNPVSFLAGFKRGDHGVLADQANGGEFHMNCALAVVAVAQK
jgi:hypothetical protein